MAPGQDEDKGLIESTPEMEDQLFDGAVTDEPPAEPEKVTAEPEKADPSVNEQPRGADGKFASKEPEKPETPQPGTEAEKPPTDAQGKEGWIPAWRARQMREEAAERGKTEADELRRQLAQLQKPADAKPAERPDPLIDPEGFTRAIREEMAAERRAERGDLSMRFARKSNPELFDKAYAAAAEAINRGDRLTHARIFNSPDPGEELIAWHKEAETRREVGNDPAAYKQRVLDEAMKDPAFQAKVIAAARGSASPNLSQSQPNGGARPAVRLPPSLTSVSPSNAALKSSDGEPNDDQLFDQLTG